MNMKGSARFPFSVFIFASLLATFIFTFSACEKEDTSEFVSQAEVVAEYVRAEDYTTNLFGLLHSSIYDTALINNGQAIIDSVFITYQVDTISGIATFLYDFDSPNQPSSTKSVYSGQVIAKLSEPFENTDAVMWASFNNYMVEDYLLQGVIYYENTGETIEGSKKYLLQYSVEVHLNNSRLLATNPSRDLFWTDGFDTPSDYTDDEFLLTGGADATYYYPTYPESTVLINVTFTEDWMLGISCSNYFRDGSFDAILSSETPTQALNGEFLDADYDNCANKVMIKNSDGSLGYPYYL